MNRRDKFIVIALIGLMVAASVAAIAADQKPRRRRSGLRRHVCRGVAGVPQYLNPVIAATDVDEDVTRLRSAVSRATTRRGDRPDLASAFHTQSDGAHLTFDIRETHVARGQPVTPMTSCTGQASAGIAIRGPVQHAFRGVTVDRSRSHGALSR